MKKKRREKREKTNREEGRRKERRRHTRNSPGLWPKGVLDNKHGVVWLFPPYPPADPRGRSTFDEKWARDFDNF